MMNSYYKQKQIIAQVNKSGDVIGKIEKWEAHKRYSSQSSHNCANL